jgi:hypothetical protein
MALFDRILNPLWHQIMQLDEVRKFDVAAIILIQGFIRSTINNLLVKQFEVMCETTSNPALHFGSLKLVPLSAEQRERLIDEASLACLCACERHGLPSDVIRSIKADVIPGLVGVLMLAEMNGRIGRQSPNTLDSCGYSHDPDESRTQLLLAWMKLLNLSDTRFVAEVTNEFFGERWRTITKSVLSGSIIGLRRTDPSVVLDRARKECSALSTSGKAVATQFVGRVASSALMETRLQAIDRISDKNLLVDFATTDPSETVRRRALLAMGIDVDEQFRLALDGVRGNNNVVLNCPVIITMCGWGVLPRLKLLCDDPDPRVRNWAMEGVKFFADGFMTNPPTEP